MATLLRRMKRFSSQKVYLWILIVKIVLTISVVTVIAVVEFVVSVCVSVLVGRIAVVLVSLLIIVAAMI